MTSVSAEPPTLRSIPAITAFSASSSQRRSYRCYNCNYSFHIVPTAATSPSPPSSFRCPGCHQRHLIPYHTISLPLPPLAPVIVQTRVAPALMNSADLSSDESESDDDDYESDNSLLSLTTPDFYRSTPASKSIVGSLPIKIFSSDSTPSQQSCSICMEDFVVNSVSSATVNELPCEHYFHKDCIVEWLQRSNSCPLCRYKLPVDPKLEDQESEYDAVLVEVLAATRETAGEIINREEEEIGNVEANPAGSGSGVVRLTANDEETTSLTFEAMRDEDGDTLMIDA